jgi:4-amino-4-deoxy-L-arabinose transferase-like glycosyltransferase
MSQPWKTRAERWLLPAIVTLYVVLGTLYALYTPDWQAPDEPAHYNYVRYVAEHYRLPVLKWGDYPAAYLEEIKAARFPPEMSIDPIRYEFHQPPLYYLLAVPVYGLSSGALLPLRLLSVALGALLLLVVCWIVRELAPNHPSLALGASAFVAFLPMHLAMTAAANNDTLAELILATILLLSVRYLKRPATTEAEGEETRFLVLLGVTTGLGLVTKSSVYVAVPLVLLATAARHLWLDPAPLSIRRALKALALYLLPALGMALPFWLRNMALYGGTDFLGLGRHDQVVVGQLRTAEYVAQHGAARLVADFFATSFRSFWGQFGWMGVLLDARLYQVLAILSVLALAGLGLWAAGAWRRRAQLEPWQWASGGLLALSVLFSLAGYLWYNTQFLQHQARYLFPALVPISLTVALGWREALRRNRALPMAALLAGGIGILALAGALSLWPLLLLVGTAGAFVVRHFLPTGWDPMVHVCPYLVLIVVDLTSLFLFIVPQLAG